jgi:hypothetical protein
MSPLALVAVIVARQWLLTLRATKLGPARVLDTHVDLLGLHVEFDLGDGPRCG